MIKYFTFSTLLLFFKQIIVILYATLSLMLVVFACQRSIDDFKLTYLLKTGF